MMTPAARKFSLTLHVIVSIGWMGSIGVFLALAIIGVRSPDEQLVRAVYRVMLPAAQLVLLPLAFASLVSGIVQSVGTSWGLFRHYWVIFKLAITAFATVILIVYMRTFEVMSHAAADPSAALDSVRNPSPLLHASLALLLLTVAAILGIYKPRGMTRYGWRKQHQERQRPKQ